MTSKICKSALPALLLLGLGAAESKASAIAFSQEAYSDAGISTTGALLGAVNVGATETVNTVSFTGITTGYTNPIALGNVTLNAFGGGGNWYNSGAPGPLTNNFVYACGAGYLTFSGLAEGQAYELQLVMSETRALNMNIWGDQATNAGASDLVVEHGNGASMLVTGTFTGDATGTQSLYIQVIPGCPGHFNALQLRAVPEPSAALLSIFGVAGLLVRRRRSAK